MHFEVDVTSRGPWSVVSVAGEIDLSTAPQFRDRLIAAIADNPQIVVDLTAVDFIDSTGLGVLLGGLKRVTAQDGRIEVVCPDTPVRKIFEVTGLNRVFAPHDDLDDVVGEE